MPWAVPQSYNLSQSTCIKALALLSWGNWGISVMVLMVLVGKCLWKQTERKEWNWAASSFLLFAELSSSILLLGTRDYFVALLGCCLQKRGLYLVAHMVFFLNFSLSNRVSSLSFLLFYFHLILWPMATADLLLNL